jgi:ABC-type sugar transport system ATPase subunit
MGIQDPVISKEVILRARGITKFFPGVKALSDVDFEVYKGEVVALLGENGAGKSTLIKILSGVYSLDSGEMELEGKSIRFSKPSDAKAAGIGIIHQELNYVASVSVAENIYMGEIPRKGIFVDYKKLYAGARQIMERIGVDVDPKIPISKCSVSQKQLLEIAKVINHEVKVLIMDEPTSALNDVETENLFAMIKKASSMGISVIYISHKLDEIFALADRVVVLRDGCVTGQFKVADTTREELIATMVGRKLESLFTKTPAKPSETAIEVSHLTNERLMDISFQAKKGEIFGIYGLLGSGHQDIGSAIFGQTIIQSGDIRVNGKIVSIHSPLDALKNGIAYVPSERKIEGLVLNNSVKINILASLYAKYPKKRVIHPQFEKRITKKWIENLRIKTPSEETITEALSGGNQQKVVLAKCLELEPDVLILNEPTRGIDVGAKAEIYKILDNLCQKGKCVIMITSEMPELITMSDRIMVMHGGTISGFLTSAEATQESVLRYAIGG